MPRVRPRLNCTQCQRRKVRCGREQPICRSCIRLQLDCQYEAFSVNDQPDGGGQIWNNYPRVEGSEDLDQADESAHGQVRNNQTETSSVERSQQQRSCTNYGIDTIGSADGGQAPLLSSTCQFLRADFAQHLRVSNQGHFGLKGSIRPQYVEPTFWALTQHHVRSNICNCGLTLTLEGTTLR